MADPSQPFAKPLAWWGIIQDAVGRRASTAEVWDAIHGYAQANGIAEPPGLFRDVNSLRSAAAQLRNSGESFLAAPDSAGMSRDYIGTLPYARPGASQAVVQQYLARVGYTVGSMFGIETKYVTLPYTGATLPATVGQLRADLESATSSYADSYGLSLVSVDSVEIGAW